LRGFEPLEGLHWEFGPRGVVNKVQNTDRRVAVKI
jgi:hypothetical protein